MTPEVTSYFNKMDINQWTQVPQFEENVDSQIMQMFAFNLSPGRGS